MSVFFRKADARREVRSVAVGTSTDLTLKST